jgi:hypothetical protein
MRVQVSAASTVPGLATGAWTFASVAGCSSVPPPPQAVSATKALNALKR